MKKEKRPNPAPPTTPYWFEERWSKTASWAFWPAWIAVVLWAYSKTHQLIVPVDDWLRVLPPWPDTALAAAGIHLGSLSKLAVFVGLCWGTGRAAVRRSLDIDLLNSLESFSLSFGLGTVLLANLMVLLAATRLMRAPFVLGSSALLCLFGLWDNRTALLKATTAPSSAMGRQRKGSASDCAGLREELRSLIWSSGWNLPTAVFVCAFLLFSGWYALAPEVFYDSLIYHLSIPSLFKMAGGFVAIPTNSFAGFPLHMEMLFGWALFAGDEILARLLHWSLGVGLAAGMLGLSLRARRPLMGWTACALFFSTPLVGMNMWRTGVEVGASYMVFLAVYTLALTSLEDGPGRASPNGLLALCAAYTGAAMAIKYTNWPLGILLPLCGLLLRRSYRETVVLALLSFAWILPWMIKDLVYYGNPIYPYLDTLLNPHNPYPINAAMLKGEAWARDWPSIFRGGWRSLWEVAAHPWFQTISGGSDGDYLGPFYLIGLPSLFLLRAKSAPARYFLLALTGIWLCWWPLTAMPRLFMPGLALLAVLLAAAADQAAPALRAALQTGLLYLAINNIFWVAAVGYQMDAWPYLLQGVSKSDYLRQSHATYPTPYYAAAEWINANTPAAARVLVVGDGRGYYLQRPFVASTVWDTNYFLHQLKSSASPEDLRSRLKQEGIDFLLVNVAEVIRLRPDAGLSEQNLNTLDAFFQKFARLRFEDRNTDPRDFRWSSVYELEATAGAPASAEPPPLVAWYWNQFKARTPALQKTGN